MSSAEFWYGTTEDASLQSRQVENVHLFKALRESEVLAVRSLIRSMAMNGYLRSVTPPLPNGAASSEAAVVVATSLAQCSGSSRRVLEDICERLHVSADRLEVELMLAAGDPLVVSAAQVDAASRRATCLDENNDVQPDTSAQDAEDDGSILVSRHVPTAAGNGSVATTSILTLSSEAATLKQSVWDTATKLISTTDEVERSELKRELEQMRKSVQQLMVQSADFLPSATSAGSSGRPMKRGRQ